VRRYTYYKQVVRSIDRSSYRFGILLPIIKQLQEYKGAYYKEDIIFDEDDIQPQYSTDEALSIIKK
jgi:hypothetical protein